MARLILEYRGDRREIPISGPITVGRSKTATISIDDLALSREHARIYSDGGRHIVADLDSKNGTLLNNTPIKQPEVLKSGDRIKIGPAALTFYLMDSGPAAAPVRARPRSAAEAASSRPDPLVGMLVNVAMIGALIFGTLIFKTLFTALLSKQ